MKNKLILCALFTCVVAQAHAEPARIVIVRHGEKPADGNHVNQQGCIRAYGLPHFFESKEVSGDYGKPVAIFAMKPNKKDDASVRPVETIAPTASKLGLKIQDPAEKLEYDTLIKALMSSEYTGKTVLVSWEHKARPGLATALGVKLSGKEEKWPGIVFDQAWVLDMTRGGYELTIIPENAIAGVDNPKGGKDNWADGPQGELSKEEKKKFPQCDDNKELDKIVARITTPAIPADDLNTEK